MHVAAQPGIEIGERFVEEQNLWFENQRARKRHPLLLTARQFARHAVVVTDKADVLQRFDGAGLCGLFRYPGNTQSVHDVLDNVHVREQRVALEHHRDVALGRSQRRHIPSVHQDLPGRR